MLPPERASKKQLMVEAGSLDSESDEELLASPETETFWRGLTWDGPKGSRSITSLVSSGQAWLVFIYFINLVAHELCHGVL